MHQSVTRNRKSAVCLFLVAVLPSLAAASGPIDPNDPPQGRFSDDWGEVLVAGEKVGFMHATMAREGDLIRTTMKMEMEIARANQRIKIASRQATTETVAGVPVDFASTMDAAVVKTSMKGRIKDGKVTITSSQFGMERTQTFDFSAGALMTWGMFRETLLQGFEPGTEYALKMYAPDLRWDGAVDTHTVLGEWEDLSHRGRRFRGQKATVTMQAPTGSMKVISWIDQHGSALKAVIPMPGLGDAEIITTDQQTALSDFMPPELFLNTMIKVNRSLRPKAIRRVKYRITSKNPDVELGALPTTDMQTPGKRDDRSVEVVLTRQSHKSQSATRNPQSSDANMSEYLDGNLMINIDDPKLIKLARKAAGGETEPFALADRLRRFVTEYVADKNLNIGFATASEVCRIKEGDCSEHGVLLAALGRLCGLPSRVAVGVAYVSALGGKSDLFGFHMWTQFFIDGRWIDVDAAMRETNCSPTRIAFATSSLKNAGMADLSLSLLTKIGAIDIDIVEVDHTPAPSD